MRYSEHRYIPGEVKSAQLVFIKYQLGALHSVWLGHACAGLQVGQQEMGLAREGSPVCQLPYQSAEECGKMKLRKRVADD